MDIFQWGIVIGAPLVSCGGAVILLKIFDAIYYSRKARRQGNPTPRPMA